MATLPVMRVDMPGPAEILPSRVTANFTATKGDVVSYSRKKAGFSTLASHGVRGVTDPKIGHGMVMVPLSPS